MTPEDVVSWTLALFLLASVVGVIVTGAMFILAAWRANRFYEDYLSRKRRGRP